MPLDSILGSVTYFGSFAWFYGIEADLWSAAVRSFEKNLSELKKPWLITLIDYRIPSNKPRLWTMNFFAPMPMLVCRTLVAHGSGSGKGKTVQSVSRQSGSNQSCVGGFVTLHTYNSGLGQKDKTKKRPALVLAGLDPTNSNARNRGIRMHGAHYVHDDRAGTSHGCICCKQDIHEELIKVIHGGSFIFSYFGEDSIKV